MSPVIATLVLSVTLSFLKMPAVGRLRRVHGAIHDAGPPAALATAATEPASAERMFVFDPAGGVPPFRTRLSRRRHAPPSGMGWIVLGGVSNRGHVEPNHA